MQTSEAFLMATYQEQLAKRAAEREAKAKAEAERVANQLNPEQIKMWRQVLVQFVGPFALIMPEPMVQEFRDRFQKRINRECSNAALHEGEKK